MDFAFDRLHDLDEKFRAKRKATDDWARLAILGVFDNALDLEWLRDGNTMLAISDQFLAHVTSTGKADGTIEVRHIPISSIVGLDLELNTKWVSNRWFEQDDREIPLGEATIHLDHPQMTSIVIPLQSDDGPSIQFITALQERIAGD